MKKIYKYILDMTESCQIISMPENACIVHVGTQNEEICLWAEVDPVMPSVTRQFFIVGTGWVIPYNEETEVMQPDYIGTVQIGYFVWHVYERYDKKND